MCLASDRIPVDPPQEMTFYKVMRKEEMLFGGDPPVYTGQFVARVYEEGVKYEAEDLRGTKTVERTKTVNYTPGFHAFTDLDSARSWLNKWCHPTQDEYAIVECRGLVWLTGYTFGLHPLPAVVASTMTIIREVDAS